MKIAFVLCPSWSTFGPPYALGLLSGVMKARGHEVSCFDLNIEFFNYLQGAEREKGWGTSGGSNAWLKPDHCKDFIRRHTSYIDRLVDKILETQAPLIGFTVYETTRSLSDEFAARLKHRDPRKVIVFGGPACFHNSVSLGLFNNPALDALCLQEGEEAFPEFVDKFQEDGRPVSCPGFACKKENGDIVSGDPRPFILNLDTTPFADFSGFDLVAYERKMLPILTSKGCVNRCVFCSEAPVWGAYRSRSASSLFDEMTFHLSKHPGIEEFFFNDSLINGDMSMLDQLCDLLIKNNVRARWGGQARIRKEMTPDFLDKMRRAGFSHVSYGLESASQRISNLMKKNLDLKVAESQIRHTHQIGIKTTLNMIVGFPGETEDDVMETLDFLRRNIEFIDDVYFHALVVLPGSGLYESKDRFGIVLPKDNAANFWYALKGDNDYETRIKRIEFYKKMIPEKYSSNISEGDYRADRVDCRSKAKDVVPGIRRQFKERLDFRLSDALMRPLVKPRWVYMSLSHRCNLDCRMCVVKTILKDHELERDLIKKAFDEISLWQGATTVVLTGGEPFLRQDIFEILADAGRAGITVEAVSNGCLIDEEKAGKIVRSALGNIAISLDGATPHVHDAIRNRTGAFQGALRALRLLSEAKKRDSLSVQISAWITIMKDNLEGLSEIAAVAEEAGAECIVYHPVIVEQADMRQTKKEAPFWIYREDAQKLRREIDHIEEYRRRKGGVAFLHDPYLWIKYFQNTLTPQEWTCNPFVFINIGPDGVVSCCGQPSFGDLHEYSLEECLGTSAAYAARRQMKKCRKPCLQTCWAMPEAGSFDRIAVDFLASLDGNPGLSKDAKKSMLAKAVELLDDYAVLLKKKEAE